MRDQLVEESEWSSVCEGRRNEGPDLGRVYLRQQKYGDSALP